MKVKIKLKDSKYCDGCPFAFMKKIAIDNEYGDRGLFKVCSLGYWVYYKKREYIPRLRTGIRNYTNWNREKDPYGFEAILKVIRPKKCIKENGK